jgi:hypothetical protein
VSAVEVRVGNGRSDGGEKPILRRLISCIPILLLMNSMLSRAPMTTKGIFMNHPEGGGSQGTDRGGLPPSRAAGDRDTHFRLEGNHLVTRASDRASGLGLASAALRDGRGSHNADGLDGPFRQSVYGWPAGDRDVNDVDRIAHDPVKRLICLLRQTTSLPDRRATTSRYEPHASGRCRDRGHHARQKITGSTAKIRRFFCPAADPFRKAAQE